MYVPRMLVLYSVPKLASAEPVVELDPAGGLGHTGPKRSEYSVRRRTTGCQSGDGSTSLRRCMS
jgi:hypothetical protein